MSSVGNTASVRVIVRLPYNRPQEGYSNPQRVNWNEEKEHILWDVINRSRQKDSAGPDWQGLSGHLEVPLPYLLYRAQRRFEEDLKGLGALTPITALPQPRPFDDDTRNGDRPDLMRRISNRTLDTVKMSSSFRLGSPRIARARLNSLGSGTGLRQLKGLSSSTLTLQGVRNKPVVQSQISSPSDSDSESNEEAERADDEARRLEEQESLEVKLKHLQSVMTSEALGLVRDARQKTKGKQVQRGRDMKSATSPSPLRQTFQRRDLSSSDFNSNTSSPQGSIPSIPSPSSDSLPQSPVSRHMTSGRKASSPAVKSHRPMAVEMVKNDQGSNHGSSASSFESLSEATSLSASALESAYLSNIRGGGSRFSQFTGHFTRRSSAGH